jgi:hypothetical protein
MDIRIWRRNSLRVFGLVLVLAAAWLVGYFQAWHKSLFREYVSNEMHINVFTHYLRASDERLCDNVEFRRAVVGQTQSDLSTLFLVNQMRENSLQLILQHPIQWFALTTERDVKSRSLNEIMARAEEVGVDVSALRPFVDQPPQKK